MRNDTGGTPGGRFVNRPYMGMVAEILFCRRSSPASFRGTLPRGRVWAAGTPRPCMGTIPGRSGKWRFAEGLVRIDTGGTPGAGWEADMGTAGMLREYGRLKWTIDRCMEQLEEEERLLLERIYIVPKIGNLELLCRELGVEKSSVYRRRDKALGRFSAVYAALSAGRSAGRQNEDPGVQWRQKQ